MKLKIIQIGKTKDAYLDEGLRDFERKLREFCEVEFVTLKEERLKDSVLKLQEAEGEKILAHLRPDDFVVVLDEKGREFDSVGFAGQFGGWLDEGRHVVFVIGGAFGLSEAVRARANFCWSLARLTFTHQMVRLILVEQIYRAWCIIKGKNYHHE